MEDKKLPKLKIGMLGDVNAGKTSFIHRFISGGFEENLVPTVGMEGQSKEVTVENRPFSALIFDTAGQEKYGTVTPSLYRDIYGVIILFDLSKQDSIKNVPRWMEEAARYKVEKMVVVGNKKDLGSWISEVLGGPKLTKFKAKLEEFSLINKVAVRVASAKTGEGVEEVFNEIFKLVTPKALEKTPSSNTIKLGKDPERKPSQGTKCCS